ncbi:hypothetical protein BDQ17DRAFT_1440322 [Cyathus striatus]|nr:hypothetical protein BDQ17DRAFT_1440322 [Cyathus striatus]
MRNKFRQLAGEIQIPKLYGAITPASLENSDDTAPTGRWSLNILEEDGRRRLLDIVEEIWRTIRTNW